MIPISGPAGHGKSTTLSATVDIINTRRGCNIITLAELCEAGKIHVDDALIYAGDRMFLRDLIQLPVN